DLELAGGIGPGANGILLGRRRCLSCCRVAARDLAHPIAARRMLLLPNFAIDGEFRVQPAAEVIDPHDFAGIILSEPIDFDFFADLEVAWLRRSTAGTLTFGALSESRIRRCQQRG